MSAFNPSAWITPDAAASSSGLSLQLIEEAIQSGRLTVRVAAGARVVRRSEINAMRLQLMHEYREGIRDDD